MLFCMQNSNLKDKKILVVGGATGIGFAVAQRALAAGADVLIGSRNSVRLNAAIALLGRGASALTIDVDDEQSVIEFFGRAGAFDHLAITVKPLLSHQRFLAGDVSALRAAFETKFWGQYRLARHAAASSRPGGSIVFTSGIASRRAAPGMSGLSAINGATEALAQSIAVELAPIRVNTVSPGLVDGVSANPEQHAMKQKLTTYLPLARFGQAAEIADAYLYFFGNTYSTGSVIVVDGGAVC